MIISPEAFGAADERMQNFKPSQRWDGVGCQQKTAAVLAAAAPIIRRDVISEVVAALRGAADRAELPSEQLAGAYASALLIEQEFAADPDELVRRRTREQPPYDNG